MPRKPDAHDRDAVRPQVGTLWWWEPGKGHASALCEVTATHWNGQQWWVKAKVRTADGEYPNQQAGSEHWNELGRFWEACHHVAATAGPKSGRGVCRSGGPRREELLRAPSLGPGQPEPAPVA